MKIETQFDKTDISRNPAGDNWLYNDCMTRAITCCVCRYWYHSPYGTGPGLHNSYILELEDKILVLPLDHKDCRELYFLAPVLYES